MADLLQTGLSWLADQFKTHASRTVSYQRGGLSVSVSATFGRTLFEQTDDSGLVERIETRDFLIQAADLVLGGLTVLPERRDRIVDTVDSVQHVYEVMGPGRDPHWRYSDVYRKVLRIHTKQIKIRE